MPCRRSMAAMCGSISLAWSQPGIGISLKKIVIGEIHEAFVVLCCFHLKVYHPHLGHQTLVVAMLLRRSTRQPRDP